MWPYRTPTLPPEEPVPPEDIEDACSTFENALRAQGRRNERALLILRVLGGILGTAFLALVFFVYVLDVARHLGCPQIGVTGSGEPVYRCR